jgi:D-glycero-alpha-D-manno-heptose-7-phosphate kinase
MAKKQTASGISTGEIDAMYEAALSSGATGGKISGAGGGGAMMFIVPPQRRIQVMRALSRAGAAAAGVHLTPQGVETWTV